MTRGLVLVLMYRVDEEYRYSRYEGRSRSHKFGFHLPLNDHWVGVIRDEPQQFDDSPHAPEAA